MKDCQEEAAPWLPGERCEALAGSPVPGCPGFLGPRHAWLVHSQEPGQECRGGGKDEGKGKTGRCSEFGQEEIKSGAGIRLGTGGIVTRIPPIIKPSGKLTRQAACSSWSPKSGSSVVCESQIDSKTGAGGLSYINIT